MNVSNHLNTFLKAEGFKHKCPRQKMIIELVNVSSLKNTTNIVIRKSDESNSYVILNTVDYQ